MNKLITILGPTATGKTKLAAGLAHEMDGEIISADSRQVYVGMDIGTGKDLKDYVVNNSQIPFHLVDIAEPGYEFNLFEFYSNFKKTFYSIIERNKLPILCGGTGLYLDSVLRGYDLLDVPENKQLRTELEEKSTDELVMILSELNSLHNTTDTTDRNRTIRAVEIAKFKANQNQESLKPQFHPVTVGINFERGELREQITSRLRSRLEEGMINEVRSLLDSGLNPDQLTFYGLEYRYVTLYVIGEVSYEEMFTKLNTAIHQFAKRQMTWFRRMEKKGVKIEWIDGHLSLEDKLEVIREKLKKIDL